jgi:hypothetical protein
MYVPKPQLGKDTVRCHRVATTVLDVAVAAQGNPEGMADTVQPAVDPVPTHRPQLFEITSSVEEAGVRTWVLSWWLRQLHPAPRLELNAALLEVRLWLVFRGPQTAAEAMDGMANAASATLAAPSTASFLTNFIASPPCELFDELNILRIPNACWRCPSRKQTD